MGELSANIGDLVATREAGERFIGLRVFYRGKSFGRIAEFLFRDNTLLGVRVKLDAGVDLTIPPRWLRVFRGPRIELEAPSGTTACPHCKEKVPWGLMLCPLCGNALASVQTERAVLRFPKEEQYAVALRGYRVIDVHGRELGVIRTLLIARGSGQVTHVELVGRKRPLDVNKIFLVGQHIVFVDRVPTKPKRAARAILGVTARLLKALREGKEVSKVRVSDRSASALQRYIDNVDAFAAESGVPNPLFLAPEELEGVTLAELDELLNHLPTDSLLYAAVLRVREWVRQAWGLPAVPAAVS